MNKIIVLALALTAIILTGCTPVDPHPSNLIGKWKAEFTTKIRISSLADIEKEADVTIAITAGANGSANFQATTAIQNGKTPETENVNGTWKQADDYLIIEQANGGFVAFRISSQSPNQLTVFSRTGQTIQFNRIP